MGEQKNSNITPVVLKYEDLTIKSNFIFSKVISIKKNCKPLLERCIKRKISNNFSIDTEKTTKIAVDGKGVRYDIYVDDSPDSLTKLSAMQRKTGANSMNSHI